MTPRYLILMGPPGAGKGTQATRLANDQQLCHISTGELLRSALAAGTALGRRAEATMAAGDLVSDDLILELVDEELDRETCDRGAVFDGFPRTIEQARGLARLLDARDARVDQVLVIDVPDEEVVRRLSGRRVCSSCEKMYHIRFDPPSKTDRCDVCGGDLVQRPDDESETVLRRLAVYREETQPVVEFYQREKTASHGGVASIDGDRPIDQVASAVRERVTSVEAER